MCCEWFLHRLGGDTTRETRLLHYTCNNPNPKYRERLLHYTWLSLSLHKYTPNIGTTWNKKITNVNITSTLWCRSQSYLVSMRVLVFVSSSWAFLSPSHIPAWPQGFWSSGISLSPSSSGRTATGLWFLLLSSVLLLSSALKKSLSFSPLWTLCYSLIHTF